MALKLPRGLYGLIDDGLRPEVPLPLKARWAIEGGAAVVQLRIEHTPDRQALAWVRAIVAQAGSTPVIVNDRVDWCLAGEAAGVHLGDDDLPVQVARELLGPDRYLGRTVRSLDEIVIAQRDGADHVGLGPIFATTTKRVSAPPLGLERFAVIARASPLPVVGIAGIGLETLGEVARAGAWCAAVGSELCLAADVTQRARALAAAWRAAGG
jgi:thiamine-phosphate pyrophosphorylase